MYYRLSAVMFPILAVALIGSGVWGYQEHQEKNAILIKAENQYQRAFHDLSYYMNQLKDELGKTMAVGSGAQDYQKRHLIQVWRMTGNAQSQINQLPLTLLPFHKTGEFLDRISNFAYRTSIRNLDKEPLSASETNTLLTLYERSKELSEELQNIQSSALSGSLRWMDVEMALASQEQDSGSDNLIIKGFKSVDDKVGGYAEVDWGPSMQSMFDKRTLKSLSGPIVTEQEVRRKAQSFLGLKPNADINISENGKGTEYQTYSALIPTKDGEIHMDFSKRGGDILWFMKPRDVGEQKLSIEEAREKADQFIRDHKYGEMVPVNYDQYNNISSITFASMREDIVYYPKKVTVKVALDNGEIIGLQAHDYVYEAEPAQLAWDGKLSEEDAAGYLHPSFRKRTTGKAYIKNDVDQKVLCYEFTGKINGSDYRVFINAESGAEEKVETIKPAEAAFGQERGE